MRNNVKNLNYFINIINDDVCLEDMFVDLNADPYRLSWLNNKAAGHLKDKDIDKLCSALTSGKCAKGVNIDLSWNSLKDKNIKKIVNVLQHPNRPEKISLDLTGNGFSDKGAIELLGAIQNGEASDIDINLSGRCFRSPHEVDFLSTGGYMKNRLAMHFLGNKITDKTAYYLADLFKHKNFPHDVSLDFSSTKISCEGVLAIVKVLEETIKQGRYPKGLSLNFEDNGVVENLQTRLDNVLKHQKIGNNFIGVASNRASFYQPVNANAVLKEIEKVESTSSLTL